MPETDYYQKYISDIVGGLMPSLRNQQKGMYDFTMANSLRTGQTARAVDESMSAYADAAGEAAAGAATTAAQMAQRQEQFDIGQENWEKSFTQGQENWEESMAFQREQQRTANMIKMFENTGWTQELMDAMGYSPDSGTGSAAFNRMLDDLGFSQPDSQDGGGGYWDQPGNRQGALGAWNNWGGQTGLVYAR
jgi:hypothetical protein